MNIVFHTYRYTHTDIEPIKNTVGSAFERIRE